MTFWWRAKLILALWLGASVFLLSIGVAAAYAVGLSAAAYGIAWAWAEWLTWISK